MCNIPTQYIINDSRQYRNFQLKTFSGYLKKDVLIAFKKALMDGLIETSCNWANELLCSGMIERIYEIFVSIMSKNIYINNPRLPYRLYKRYNNYLNLYKYYNNIQFNNTNNKNKEVLIHLRNVQQIRNHICELCVIISRSPKTSCLSLTIIKEMNLNSYHIKKYINVVGAETHTNAASIANVSRSNFSYNNDPEEILIIMNEFQSSIKKGLYKKGLYILSWILSYEKKMQKNGIKLRCGKRPISNIDQKYHNDLIWMVWEIILKESSKLDTVAKLQVNSLYIMYKYEYSTTQKYKRLPLLLTSIKFNTELYNITTPIINNNKIITMAIGNINYLFHNMRSFEIHIPTPNTIVKDRVITPKTKLSKNTIIKIHKLDEIDTLMLNSSLNNKSVKFCSNY